MLIEYLVDPAGAGPFRWRQYRSVDRISPYCCLYARAGWWIQVARYIMNNGRPGEPLLSDLWFDYLMGTDLTADDRREGVYRSQIRYDILDREGEAINGPFLYFTGLGGQITYLLPDQDVIVVRFGDRYQLLHTTLYEIARFQ